MTKEIIDNNIYITVLGFKEFYGSKPFVLEGIVKLSKEPSNKYDTEAIACYMRHFVKIGYVANSTHSVITGTMSAGRLYDKIDDTYFARIKFIASTKALCQLLTLEEYENEKADSKSDVHFIKVEGGSENDY